MHISDLHLGKRVNEFSMLEDQRYILKEIQRIAREEAADAVLIAGDVYDKPIPPAEAVSLLDEFLCALAAMGKEVFLISGNHDSAERLSFGGRLMKESGIHIAPVYGGTLEPIYLEDAGGKLAVYLLPFLKPALVRPFFPDEELGSTAEAVRAALSAAKPDPELRNVLVTHQFVTGSLRSESEEILVGGLDDVPASVFEAFDYVALGHIHAPQSISRETLRYSGTPLKYSFSEARQEKSVTILDWPEKGRLSLKTVPLVPLRDMRELKGTYNELTERKNYENTNTKDYLHLTLTDEEDVPEAVSRLRVIYPNLMKLDYDNTRTRSTGSTETVLMPDRRQPQELFAEFFEKQNGKALSEEQAAFCDRLIREIWEEKK